MTDTRRVCDLSPLELYEAAIEASSKLGWTSGSWQLELFVETGQVRQIRAHIPGVRKASMSRKQLDRLGGVQNPAA